MDAEIGQSVSCRCAVERSRVKLASMEDGGYINANYVDVSAANAALTKGLPYNCCLCHTVSSRFVSPWYRASTWLHCLSSSLAEHHGRVLADGVGKSLPRHRDADQAQGRVQGSWYFEAATTALCYDH